MDFLIYISIKTVVYIGWIYFGLLHFKGGKTGYLSYAIVLGLLRTIAGVATAILSFFVVGFLFNAILPGVMKTVSPTFLWPLMIIFLPGRVLLWLGLSRVITSQPVSIKRFWIVGGVVISTLFDLYAVQRIGYWTFVG